MVAQLVGLALGILILVKYINFQDGSPKISLVGMLHSFRFLTAGHTWPCKIISCTFINLVEHATSASLATL